MITTNKVEHELKYIVSNSRAVDMIGWLSRYCEPDPEYPRGMISSIYYDTLQWKYLDQKLNSFYLKTKVRLRWYSDLHYSCHDDAVFVELKYKIGSRRGKIRVKSTYSGTEIAGMPLEDARLLMIPHILNNKGVIIKDKLLPAFQITYKRFRYIDPYSMSRICFDFDIHSPRVNSIMLPYMNPVMLQTAVFEVKGNESELPSSLYPLTDMGLKKSAFSKYSACYRKLMRRHF